jgi:site-specific DNA recombinase
MTDNAARPLVTAAIYTAVSTEEQADPSKPSMGEQERQCRDFCRAQGWQIVDVVRLQGQSRNYSRLDRLMADSPDYARLVGLIEREAIKVIVVWSYDRLWRDDLLRAQMAAICREHHVHVYSLSQPTPAGDSDTSFWMELIFGGLAQQENKIRVRRWRVGVRGRIARGLTPTGRVSYGYRRGANGKVAAVVHETEAAWVRQIFAWRAMGWGSSHIARELERQKAPLPSCPRARAGYWGPSTVYKILRNPFYVGKTTMQDDSRTTFIGDGQHEPIISLDLWDRVQQINEKRMRPSPHGKTRLLTGLCRCSECGYRMSYTHGRIRSDPALAPLYLRCGMRSGFPPSGCKAPYAHALAVHDAVIRQIKQELLDQDGYDAALAIRAETDTRQKLLAQHQRNIAEIDVRLRRWYDALEAGTFPLAVVAERQQELLDQRRAREAEIIQVEDEIERGRRATERRHSMSDLVSQLDTLPLADQRRIILALVKDVIVYPDNRVEIVWN